MSGSTKGMVDALERKPPAFDPGTKWAYSNAGFVLLGRIIETVTGQDYYDYLQKNVFAPAGATSASFPLLPKNGVAVVPMAYPYEPAWDNDNLRLYTQNQLGKNSDAAVLRAAPSFRHSTSSSSRGSYGSVRTEGDGKARAALAYDLSPRRGMSTRTHDRLLFRTNGHRLGGRSFVDRDASQSLLTNG